MNYILNLIKYKSIILNYNNISQIYFYCIKDVFQMMENHTDPNLFWNSRVL